MARRLAALRARTAVRRERRQANAAAAGHRPDDEPSPAEILERVTLHRAVVDAVLALDEPYRTAVLLRFWEDLSPREVAARCKVPLETARTRIKRGLTSPCEPSIQLPPGGVVHRTFDVHRPKRQ